MISDYECARNCQLLYNNVEAFDRIIEVSGVFAGLQIFPECNLLVFRGSSNFLDWQRDFLAFQTDDPAVGPVELGFSIGLRDILPFIPKGAPLVVTGHSLGAARALIFAGIAAGEHAEIAKVTVFGSPRPGAQKLARILSCIPVFSYRNRHDQVTNVPFDLPDFSYTHPAKLIPVDAAPSFPNAWGLLADHHMELYLEAMHREYNKPFRGN